MRLNRALRRSATISLVAMVDVLMIMLVFFMVTSTYLHLDMVPLVARDDSPPSLVSDSGAVPPPSTPSTLLVRLAADGSVRIAGRPVAPADLGAVLRDRTRRADTTVVVLPAAQARMQSLVGLMDAATAAGVVRLRLLQLAPPT